jgi:glycosyltransferase involved in cell wall biosynthesis
MISIVMAYYNRLGLLRHTLNTFMQSLEKDFEVVIVDDFSDLENSLDTISDEFPSLKIKIIKMSDRGPKTWFNPCVPYNVGFRESSGDKIIIQNPECCHVGDVISYVNQTLTDDNYLTFHCWACNKGDVRILQNGGTIDVGETNSSKTKWYNHGVHHPVGYHFTSAITKKNLSELNGFDEEFALGHSYDDDEFLQRIKNKKLNITFVESPYVIHQWHPKMYNNPMAPPATVDNQQLLARLQESVPPIIRANNKEPICGI